MKILFMVNDFVGPQNACLGLAQTMRDHGRNGGHHVIFALRREFFPKFFQFGFNENDGSLIELKPTIQQPEKKQTLQMLVEKIRQNGFVSSMSPLDKVRQMKQVNLVKTSFEDQLRDFDGQLTEILKKTQPDLIIYDGEVIPPAILFWKECPWVYLFCSQPIGLFDSDLLPPFLSDFSTESNPGSWREFRQVLDECYYQLIRDSQKNLCKTLGYPEPPRKENGQEFPFFIHSPFLNLYQYPLEMDYQNLIEIPSNCFRVDSFCRDETDGEKHMTIQELLPGLPQRFLERNPQQKLIYLSLGSMGSCNLDLMNRLISILSRTNYFYFISLGPLWEQLNVKQFANMFAQSYLPQISILKRFKIDLAIIHGGNNSLTEIIQFGVPLLIMPLFYDQFLNAQRVVECQLGCHLNPFQFEDNELLEIIDQMLKDQKLIERVKHISIRIQRDQSKIRCCRRLEQLIDDFCQ